MEFATPPNYRKNSNFLTIDLKSPITKFSSRQSLVSPSSAHIALTENLTGMLNSRKSSIVNGPLSVRESPQLQMSTNALSLLALGKMRQKAAQTKEFIKSQAAPRLGMIELTIHNSEIAKVRLDSIIFI